MKKALLALALAVALAGGVRAGNDDDHENDRHDYDRFEFQPGTLVLSRSVYVGAPSMLVPGTTVLPPGCVPGPVNVPLVAGGTVAVVIPSGFNSGGCTTAVADGTYPSVFANDTTDGSFGITSPIFLDNITSDGHKLGTLRIPTDQIVTSFSSKSELALNLALDRKSITFMGYRGGPGFVTGPNQFDVSNSNTPGVVDPTNPVVSQYYRSVAEVDAHGRLHITEGNAYSGNNGRAAIKADWMYYMVGNDNNGGLSKGQLTTTQPGVNLVNSTGAELLVPGQTPPVPPNITKIGDFEVTQASVGYKTADKPGKDNNFRGLTIFNNTMYVTKGSGGNGVNTVYQVGNAGTLPTDSSVAALAALPITILPGFPTTLASGVALDGTKGNPVAYPFGIWFANSSTLYVCDEGDGTLVPLSPANANLADAATLATAGLQKWSLVNGKWQMLYVIQDGLNIGVPYGIEGYPAALNPATGGCRNLTGKVNRDGTVTVYAVTSTVSTSGDQGADPNLLVKVIDKLDATVLSKGDGDHDSDDRLDRFKVIRRAKYGEVLRGVAFAPQDRDDDHHDDHDGDWR